MRLLHVQKVAGVGGSERHLLALLPALAERGHDVTMAVLAAPGSPAFSAMMASAGIEVVVVPAGRDLNPAVVARLLGLVRRLRPDLVHTHLIHADLYGQLAARLAGVPSVCSVHATRARYGSEAYRPVAAIAGRQASRTIAISEHVAQFLLARRLVAAPRVRVVPYGIDLLRWRPDRAARARGRAHLGLGKTEVAVVVASRLVPHKGHDVLLQAFSRVVAERPEMQLIVAGEGPLRAALQREAVALGIAAAVRFLGFVDDVSALMAAADIVAFPTLPAIGEGFGLVSLEAMALGLPVVATSVDSVPEVVIDGETGILVEPGHVGAMAAALSLLGGDEPLRRRLGEQGRRRAELEFGLDRMVEKTVAVYAELLAGSGSPSSGKR